MQMHAGMLTFQSAPPFMCTFNLFLNDGRPNMWSLVAQDFTPQHWEVLCWHSTQSRAKFLRTLTGSANSGSCTLPVTGHLIQPAWRTRCGSSWTRDRDLCTLCSSASMPMSRILRRAHLTSTSLMAHRVVGARSVRAPSAAWDYQMPGVQDGSVSPLTPIMQVKAGLSPGTTGCIMFTRPSQTQTQSNTSSRRARQLMAP